jgi:hypothetical protein
MIQMMIRINIRFGRVIVSIFLLLLLLDKGVVSKDIHDDDDDDDDAKLSSLQAW